MDDPATSVSPSYSLDPAWRDELIRCFWMATAGRTEDLGRYLRRMLPKWRERDAELARGIESLLQKGAEGEGTALTRRMPPRARGTETAQAIDEDRSGENLLRLEHPVKLSLEPVWADTVAHDLDSIVMERQALADLTRVGLAPTKTAIFTGPPGVGKTLAARWIARELDLPLASLNLGSVMSSFLGRTGANLRNVMSYAAAHPCVLFLDEIDAVAKRRDDDSDVGELKRLVTVLLQEIDAWPVGGLLLAATNHEQLLDPAVWRRFERRVIFPLPDRNHQSQLLERLLEDEWRKLEPELQTAVATAAQVLSPSDLSQVATRALRDAVLGLGPLDERLAFHLQNALSLLPLSERRRSGQALKSAGVGQREIHRLTGLARETIRGMSARKST